MVRVWGVRGGAARAAGMALAMALAACGGGGGGGSDQPPAQQLVVGNVRVANADQEVFEGRDPLQTVNLTADITGNLQALNGNTVYVIVEDPDQLFSATPTVVLGSGGLNNVLGVLGRPENTRVGDFTGPLRVNVCLDAQCRTPLAGSPVSVPYRIRVLPGLKVTGQPALAATFGQLPTPWQGTVQLPAGATSYTQSLRWVSFPSGIGVLLQPTDIFTVSGSGSALSVAGMRARIGQYTATLSLSANGTTSKGRFVTQQAEKTFTYEVTGTSTPTLFTTPGTVDVTLPYASLFEPQGGLTALTSINASLAGGVFRIEYLPAATGRADAQGIAWLFFPSAATTVGLQQLVQYGTRACNFLPSGQRSCLPPGRYEANVWLRTATGTEFSPPVPFSLTITP